MSQNTLTLNSVAAALVQVPIKVDGLSPENSYEVDGDRTIIALPSPVISREHSNHSLTSAKSVDEPIWRMLTPTESEEEYGGSRASANSEEQPSGIELTRRIDAQSFVRTPSGPHKLLQPPSPHPASAVLDSSNGNGNGEIEDGELEIRNLSIENSTRRASTTPTQTAEPAGATPRTSRFPPSGGGARKNRKKSFSKLRVEVGPASADRPKYRSEVLGCDEIMEVGDWAVQGETIYNASSNTGSPEAAEDPGENRWLHLTREQFVRKALLPGGELDARRENIDMAIADVKYFSVFETSYPIAAALSKPGFRVAIFCTAVCYAVYAGHEGNMLARTGRIMDTKQIRFKPILEEHHRRHGLGDWVLGMELLSDGCPISLPNATVLGTTEDFLVIPSRPVDFNGVVIRTNLTGQDSASRGFTLEAVQGDDLNPGIGGPNWRVIGGQKAYMTMDGVTQWQSSDARDWYKERDGLWSISVSGNVRTARVSLSPPWHAWFGLFSLTLGLAVSALALTGLSVWGKAAWGKKVVVGMLLVVFACLATNAGVCVAERNERQSSAVLQFLNAAAILMIGVGLMLREQAALALWLYAAIHFTVMHTVEDEVMAPSKGPQTWIDMPLLSYVFTAVGVIFLALRYRLLVNSARDIAMDMQCYRQAWSNLMDQHGECIGIDQIAQAIQDWHNHPNTTNPNWPVLQRCRAEQGPLNSTGLERFGSVGGLSHPMSMGSRFWGFMSNGLGSPFLGNETASEYWLNSARSQGNLQYKPDEPESPAGSTVMSRGGQSSAASSTRTFGSAVPLLRAVERRRRSMESGFQGKKDARSWDGKQRSSLGAPPPWATFKGGAAAGGAGGVGRMKRGSAEVRTLQPRTGQGGSEDGGAPSSLDAFTEEGSQIGWSSEEGGSLEGRSPESDPGKGKLFSHRSSMGSLAPSQQEGGREGEGSVRQSIDDGDAGESRGSHGRVRGSIEAPIPEDSSSHGTERKVP